MNNAPDVRSTRGRLMGEDWKPVPGFSHAYEVSNRGRVRSWLKGRWGRRKKPRVLQPAISNGNYKHVSLVKNRTKHTTIIHVLVAEVFVGPRPHGARIIFKDGDRTNTNVENIEYLEGEKE